MDVVLDLPVPPSVNRTRVWDRSRRAAQMITRWRDVADKCVLAAKCRTNDRLRLTKIARFELLITLSETHTRIDLDNGLKCLIDYLHHIELIEDDGPKHMRRLTVEWGHAPEGVRIVVRPIEDRGLLKGRAA